MQLTITPKEAYAEILANCEVGLVPMFTASPGVGKSAIVRKVAKDYKLKLIDLRLSQAMPEDLNGFPKIFTDTSGYSTASYVPFDTFPLDTDEIPDGYNGWLLFFDEITSSTKPVQAASYKVILDGMVGNRKLHPNVYIVAAGNKSTDKAVVNQMSTALQSRMIHYEMVPSVPDFTENALQENYDHRIIAFVNEIPSRLMRFDPTKAGQEKTFPCPRTYEFLSRLIKNKEVTEKQLPRVAGAIGQGTAIEFITFCQEYGKLPKLADVISDPKTTAVPVEASTKYATMFMLIENATTQNLGAILDYISRFGIEQQIVFSRSVHAVDPSLVETNGKFSAYVQSMTKYLG